MGLMNMVMVGSWWWALAPGLKNPEERCEVLWATLWSIYPFLLEAGSNLAVGGETERR